MPHVTWYICIRADKTDVMHYQRLSRADSPSKSMRERLIISIVVVNGVLLSPNVISPDNKARGRPAPLVNMFHVGESFFFFFLLAQSANRREETQIRKANFAVGKLRDEIRDVNATFEEIKMSENSVLYTC